MHKIAYPSQVWLPLVCPCFDRQVVKGRKAGTGMVLVVSICGEGSSLMVFYSNLIAAHPGNPAPQKKEKGEKKFQFPSRLRDQLILKKQI